VTTPHGPRYITANNNHRQLLTGTGHLTIRPIRPQVPPTRRIRSEINLEGPLNDQDRRRLVEIADRCPVHHTLGAEIALETTEA
jgi:uncharacterized OsmC-like protein